MYGGRDPLTATGRDRMSCGAREWVRAQPEKRPLSTAHLPLTWGQPRRISVDLWSQAGGFWAQTAANRPLESSSSSDALAVILSEAKDLLFRRRKSRSFVASLLR